MTTLRNKIGQMLIMGFAGTDIYSSPIVEWLSKDNLGGVLLFDKDYATGKHGKNLESLVQIQKLISDLKKYASCQPLIAIDYEGGSVDRLKHIPDCPPTITPKEQGFLKQSDFDKVINQMGDTLKSLGFNLNFAPVTDLNLNETQGIIGKLHRCFSSDPEKVSHCAQRFIELFNQKGLIGCYKHFPGHGSAIGDTHTGFVDVTTTWQPAELIPYQALAKMSSLQTMVMTAHVINRNLDPSGLPASLSYPIVTGLLRQELGFQGVIISDDLQMHAIAHHYSLDEALTLAINAGSDLLILGNQLGFDTAPDVIASIEKLVLQNHITRARIDESYQRIMDLKQFVNKSSKLDFGQRGSFTGPST